LTRYVVVILMTTEWPPTAKSAEIEVLHVDDEAAFLDLSKTMLERQDTDITVTTVTDPTTVLDGIRSTDVDCVVSDYDMPRLNGVELLESIREHDTDLPVILFTGKGSEEVASEAISAGVTDYVRKGGDAERFEMLANRIQNAVGRYRAEQRLAYESSLLDTIFEQIPHHMYVKDSDGRHLRVSHAHVDDPEEVIGKTDAELYPADHSDQTVTDDQKVIEHGEPVIHKEEPMSGELGETYSYDHVIDQYEGDVATDKERFNEWALTSKVPWRDDDGDVVGLIGITFDISDRKHYQRTLERHAERLEQFLAEVAHDIRSSLQVAASNVALLRESGEAETERLDAISRAHERIETLVDDLRTFARHGELGGDETAVDIEAVAEGVWNRHEPAEATLKVDSLPTVAADTSQVDRLVDNLVANAVDHGATDVTIRFGALDDGAGFYVADDGPGIPAGERDAVFNTGYTTREKGTGLGLAIVETVATRHGWSVSVTESDAGGARFEVRFDE